ncbi:Putative leucine Rich Repeat family protein [Candidatus Glomeribacter gigasporarum BEG34]|uniref:Putative leucine Rich Repeat family protein n=1 Tax=Candidatus Glomeribacter gigasporarum BEG34 TaxID=1070319 RepID=G2J7N3_9BURK|nr:hypothetical protein [Candidatus Glomeribacter gigasporarum]CCD28778.1 Putative leucine Rich Repeat family protein [Candidatus Glomeribacter gigasporarum BEG34]
MLTGTSLSSGMYLPYEIISEIFKYTLDARPLNEYSFCLNDKSEPRNLELISRWFERDVKRILREERPEIMRAIAAGALSRIALHWTGDMEKVGPQRDLFVKNVKSVTERCSHLALDLDDILACGAGYGLSATDIHHSITTILEVIRNQYQKDFPIQSFEFKAPAAVNFSSPGFFRASGHFETGFMRLFLELGDIAENARDQKIRFLLDLGGSGIKDDDIHDLTEMLGLNTIIIEKLDLSENSFSLQGITELVDLFKDKPVQSLYFRNFRSSNIGTLFDSLIQASRNINLGLLDISGSVLSDDAFTGLCALIGSNADIKRLNIKNCRINNMPGRERLSESIHINTHLRTLDLLEKPIDIGNHRHSFSLDDFIQKEAKLKVEGTKARQSVRQLA